MNKEQLPHCPSQADVSPTDIEDTKCVLRNLSSLASAAIGVSRDRAQDCESLDGLQQRIQVLQYLVDRMGWVADVGLRKLGDRGSLARPEDWMLPEV